MDNLLGDYGIMDASEQEQDFYMSMKGLQSTVGDKGLGQEPGTVSVDGRAFRVYICLTAVGTSGRGLPRGSWMSAQSIVSDLPWVLVRNGDRWILLRSSAAKVSGLQGYGR